MKKISIFCIIILLLGFLHNINAQSRKDWPLKKAEKWVMDLSWKKNFKAMPHSSIDVHELAYQYHKNPELWEKAFTFLANTNLDTLSVGKHKLSGDDLFVSVSQEPVKDLENTKWEAHQKYIDIQYVIVGKEKMGKINRDKTTTIVAYDDSKDIGFYSAPESEATYYEASPAVFLIFFPKDAHRPGIKINGYDTDKKLVVKIKTAE